MMFHQKIIATSAPFIIIHISLVVSAAFLSEASRSFCYPQNRLQFIDLFRASVINR
jgi:hypothetical protein